MNDVQLASSALTQPVDTRERLPLGALLALATAGFITVLTEAMPAGLLPQMSAGLNVSQALIGQLVTLYAVGSMLAAIPLTIATRGWRRRRHGGEHRANRVQGNQLPDQCLRDIRPRAHLW